MIWDNKAYEDTLRNFRVGRTWLSDVSVEIEGGEAEVEPLTLLRIYDEKPTVDNNNTLASLLCNKKRVVFRRKDVEIYSFVYQGDELASYFKKCPWLLDTLHQAAYAILIKKLTPPSEDSRTEEKRSE